MTLTAAQFLAKCDEQIDSLSAENRAELTRYERVGMDWHNEWSNDKSDITDEYCQMCDKPMDEFPTKASSGISIPVPDNRLFIKVHPQTGTHFEWTICPDCCGQLSNHGIRDAGRGNHD